MTLQDSIELLAPVSGPDGLDAALAGGANAVYLGLKGFNARQKAENFDEEALEQAVLRCHQAHCRVYLTLNTLIREKEMKRALDAMGQAYEMGVDALIIQDLGLILAAKNWLPQFVLHASTQMTGHHPSQIKPLADMGIKRIILARELNLSEVKAMVKEGEKYGVGMEVFVHGALCVSYSGQCLISSLLEKRSGNRGLCAQLCRRPFSKTKEGRKSLLLSPRDLSALPLLHDLTQTGVISLKIEGRLKRPEYVAGVTLVYRQALNRIASGQKGPFPDLEEKLRMVFNRGFTLGGLGKEFDAAHTTGAWGGPKFMEIGDLLETDYNRARICVHVKNKPEPGDGAAIFSSTIDLPFPFVVTKVFEPQGNTVWIGIKSLDRDLSQCPSRGVVYLSSKAKELDRIRDTVKSYEPPQIPVKISCSGTEDKPLEALAVTGPGWEARAQSKNKLTPASNKPLDKMVLEEQFSRLGGTPYKLERLIWKTREKLFLPKSDLNGMRRHLVEALEVFRTARCVAPEPPARFTEESFQAEETMLSVLCSVKQAKAALDGGADRVYCPANEIIKGMETRVWMWIPAITPFPYYKEVREWVLSNPGRVEGVLAGHLGAAMLAKEADLPFWADASLNLMNPLSCDLIRKLEAKGAALSWEMDLKAIESLVNRSSLPLEVILLGRAPLMHSGLKGFVKKQGFLFDDQDRSFPITPWPGRQGFTLESDLPRIWTEKIPKAAFVRLDLRGVSTSSFVPLIQCFKGKSHPTLDRTQILRYL